MAGKPQQPSCPPTSARLIVERYRAAGAVVTTSRQPIPWLGLMADPCRVRQRLAAVPPPHERVLECLPPP